MDKLTPKQIEAAHSLVAGRSGKETAKSVGVQPETISRWKNEPQFIAYMNLLKQEGLDGMVDQMRRLGTDALSTLLDVMRNSKSDRARMKAVEIVLYHLGWTDIQKGMWGWGVGPTSPELVAREQRSKARPQLAALLGDIEL